MKCSIKYLRVEKAESVWPDQDDNVPEFDADVSDPKLLLGTILQRKDCKGVSEVYLQTLRADGSGDRWKNVDDVDASELPREPSILRVKVVVSSDKRSREEFAPGWKEELKNVKHELALVKRARQAASQTTLNEENIAKEFEGSTTVVQEFPLKELSPEQYKTVIQKCLEMLKGKKLKKRACRNFDDMIRWKQGKSKQCHERKHMQPIAFELLQTVATAVGSSLDIVDAHSQGLQPNPALGKIDLVLVPKEGLHSYSNLVAFTELKLPASSLSAAFGQSVTRLQHIFEQQPERSFVYFIGMTPGQLELVRWQKIGSSSDEWSFKAEKMPQQLLTCNISPADLCTQDRISPGLMTLAQLLATPTSELGYQPPDSVHQEQLPEGLLHSLKLLCRGTRLRAASRVYAAKLGEEGVVIKCGCKQREVQIMQQLQRYATAHLPQLVAVLDSGSWRSFSQAGMLRSLVMRPFCQPLSAADGAQVLAQVAADIASTVDWLCNQRLILHRDISSSNIAKHSVDGHVRGVLLDFGASKIAHKYPEDNTDGGAPRNLTGTPCFVSLSLLEDTQSSHTVSTHLESLYLSIRHIIVPLPDLYSFQDYSSVSRWATSRRGTVMKRQQQLANLKESDCPNEQQLGRFLESLHGLFWPVSEELAYRYCSEVSAAQFVDVCKLYNSELLPAKL